MTNLDKEIKRILLGKTKILEDGRLSTLEDGDYIMPRGISDGAGAVRFLGVAKRSRILRTELDDRKLKEAVKKAMQNIGRGIVLQKEPEAIACLLRYLLTRPVVLCFSYQGEEPVLSACTGRGLTGWISRLRAVRTFEKELPDTVEISLDKPADTEKEEKEKKKQEKAARKEARKKRKEREEGTREKKKGRKKAAKPENEQAGEQAAAADGNTAPQTDEEKN